MECIVKYNPRTSMSWQDLECFWVDTNLFPIGSHCSVSLISH